jgi:hypothetical protein
MKKRMSENTQRSAVDSYPTRTDNMNAKNWFATHKKLLWGIGGAVVLGAGAMLLLKNKSDKEANRDIYNELNAFDEIGMTDLPDEEIIITTITELD